MQATDFDFSKDLKLSPGEGIATFHDGCGSSGVTVRRHKRILARV